MPTIGFSYIAFVFQSADGNALWDMLEIVTYFLANTMECPFRNNLLYNSISGDVKRLTFYDMPLFNCITVHAVHLPVGIFRSMTQRQAQRSACPLGYFTPGNSGGYNCILPWGITLGGDRYVAVGNYALCEMELMDEKTGVLQLHSPQGYNRGAQYAQNVQSLAHGDKPYTAPSILLSTLVAHSWDCLVTATYIGFMPTMSVRNNPVISDNIH